MTFCNILAFAIFIIKFSIFTEVIGKNVLQHQVKDQIPLLNLGNLEKLASKSEKMKKLISVFINPEQLTVKIEAVIPYQIYYQHVKSFIKDEEIWVMSPTTEPYSMKKLVDLQSLSIINFLDPELGFGSIRVNFSKNELIQLSQILQNNSSVIVPNLFRSNYRLIGPIIQTYLPYLKNFTLVEFGDELLTFNDVEKIQKLCNLNFTLYNLDNLENIRMEENQDLSFQDLKLTMDNIQTDINSIFFTEKQNAFFDTLPLLCWSSVQLAQNNSIIGFIKIFNSCKEFEKLPWVKLKNEYSNESKMEDENKEYGYDKSSITDMNQMNENSREKSQKNSNENNMFITDEKLIAPENDINYVGLIPASKYGHNYNKKVETMMPGFDDNHTVNDESAPASEYEHDYNIKDGVTSAPEFDDDHTVDDELTTAPEYEHDYNIKDGITSASEPDDNLTVKTESSATPKYKYDYNIKDGVTSAPEFDDDHTVDDELTTAPEYKHDYNIKDGITSASEPDDNLTVKTESSPTPKYKYDYNIKMKTIMPGFDDNYAVNDESALSPEYEYNFNTKDTVTVSSELDDNRSFKTESLSASEYEHDYNIKDGVTSASEPDDNLTVKTESPSMSEYKYDYNIKIKTIMPGFDDNYTVHDEFVLAPKYKHNFNAKSEVTTAPEFVDNHIINTESPPAPKYNQNYSTPVNDSIINTETTSIPELEVENARARKTIKSNIMTETFQETVKIKPLNINGLKLFTTSTLHFNDFEKPTENPKSVRPSKIEKTIQEISSPTIISCFIILRLKNKIHNLTLKPELCFLNLTKHETSIIEKIPIQNSSAKENEKNPILRTSHKKPRNKQISDRFSTNKNEILLQLKNSTHIKKLENVEVNDKENTTSLPMDYNKNGFNSDKSLLNEINKIFKESEEKKVATVL